MLLNKSMHSALGWLYAWKNVLLIVTLFLSIIIYRPFCKYICPLGAIYSVFNLISVFRHRVDESKCTHCRACARALLRLVPKGCTKRARENRCLMQRGG